MKKNRITERVLTKLSTRRDMSSIKIIDRLREYAPNFFINIGEKKRIRRERTAPALNRRPTCLGVTNCSTKDELM